MDVRVVDGSAQVAGSRAFPSTDPDGRSDQVLLALADGSVWGASRPRSGTAVSGVVRLLHGRVVMGDSAIATVCPAELNRLARHLQASHSRGEIRGCVTASGATTPLHARVALAVARGEIGRP